MLLVDPAAALRTKIRANVTIRDRFWLHLTGGEASHYTASEPLIAIPITPIKIATASNGCS